MDNLDDHVWRALAYACWSAHLNTFSELDASHLVYGVIRAEREYNYIPGIRGVLGEDKANSVEHDLCRRITGSAEDREVTRVYPIWNPVRVRASELILSTLQRSLHVAAMRNRPLSIQLLAIGLLVCGDENVWRLISGGLIGKTQLVHTLCSDAGVTESDFISPSMHQARLYKDLSQFLCSSGRWMTQGRTRCVPYPDCFSTSAREVVRPDKNRGQILANDMLRVMGVFETKVAENHVVRGRRVAFDKVSYNLLCFAVEAATSVAAPVIELEWIRLGRFLASSPTFGEADQLLDTLTGSKSVLAGRSRGDLKRIAGMYKNGNCIPPESLEVLAFG